jgi:hypothetical protein
MLRLLTVFKFNRIAIALYHISGLILAAETVQECSSGLWACGRCHICE